MFPHERSLVEDYQGRPFVLLGVNNDAELERVHTSIKKNKINWRSFYDGSGGPIVRQFRVQSFPTIMLIDHRGIIQHAKIREGLDGEIERLVSVAEGAGMVGDLIVPEQRTFRDKTGDHRIVATAIAREGDNIVLLKEDGSEITVALEDLSKADQRYLRTVELEAVAAVIEEPAREVGDEATEDFRTFSAASGGYEVEARFIEFVDGMVKLEKRDGKVIEVPMEKLSDGDQQWIRDQE